MSLISTQNDELSTKPRHYLMTGLATLVLLFGQNNLVDAIHNRPINDKDRLNMALEYSQSEKYHEALLLFQKPDQGYLLNQRRKAYIGVCYYHLWKYEQVCLYLDSVMSSIAVFTSHEQSVYYYANAENHFQLKQYEAAIPCYEKILNVCHGNEKADALYRLGFCYLFNEDWENALEYFESAHSYYQRYGYKPGSKYRMAQIENMINGCKQQIDQSTSTTLPSDSIKRNTAQATRKNSLSSFCALHFFTNFACIIFIMQKMKTLIDRILKNGKCHPGGMLKVDKFISHQMDSNLMKVVAIEFTKRYASTEINKILTIEASGITPAIVMGLLLDLPVVFAKKKKPSTMDNILSTTVFLFTKQHEYNVVISRDYLTPNDKVIFIDDFLAYGNIAKGIIDLCRQVGAELAGMGFIIEETFQHGRDGIEAEGVRCESLAMIGSLDNC